MTTVIPEIILINYKVEELMKKIEIVNLNIFYSQKIINYQLILVNKKNNDMREFLEIKVEH